jgi:hypothetical protein
MTMEVSAPNDLSGHRFGNKMRAVDTSIELQQPSRLPYQDNTSLSLPSKY